MATGQADMFKQDVLEPLAVDEQIIKSATEVASMLLKIDDLIARSNQNAPGPLGCGREMGVWAAATAVVWICSRLVVLADASISCVIKGGASSWRRGIILVSWM
jgi:hypothetical protein